MQEQIQRAPRLQVTTKTIKLHKQYKKVLDLCAAYDNTYCFFGIRDAGDELVVHFNEDGKILYEYLFQSFKFVNQIVMTSPTEVIALQTRKHRITIIDLEKRNASYLTFYFMNEQSQKATMFTFPDSKLLCVCETGGYNSPGIKLTFFKYPLRQGDKPYSVFQSQDHWDYTCTIVKGNQTSQLLWFSPRHDEKWLFYIFELDGNQKGSVKKCTYPNTIGQQYGLEKIECMLTTMWQMRPNEYILIAKSNIPNPEGTYANMNFIVNTKTGDIRQSKLRFGQYQRYTAWEVTFGKTSTIRTLVEDENQNPIASPTYYIDNQKEEIIAEEILVLSNTTHLFLLGYEKDVIILSTHKNAKISQITVSIKRMEY